MSWLTITTPSDRCSDMEVGRSFGGEDKTTYNRQTIKDNLRLFTPEILDKINQLVVKAGHGLVKKNAPKDGPTRIRTEKKIELHDSSKALRARCDSFVVETREKVARQL